MCDILNGKDTICRTCLAEEEVKISAFDLQLVETELVTLAAMIRNCADVEIKKNDAVSTFICSKCVKNITLFFRFRQKCQISNDILLAKSKQPKEEPAETIVYGMNAIPPDESAVEPDVIEIDDDDDDDAPSTHANGEQSSNDSKYNNNLRNGTTTYPAGEYEDTGGEEDTGEVEGSMNCGWMGYESDDNNEIDNNHFLEETVPLKKVKVEESEPTVQGAVVAPATGVRLYDCMYCGMTFPSKWKQSIHMCEKKPRYKTGARGYTKKSSRKYTPVIMAKAMKEVAHGRESIYKIAQKYNIPKNTLIYRAQKAGYHQPQN